MFLVYLAKACLFLLSVLFFFFFLYTWYAKHLVLDALVTKIGCFCFWVIVYIVVYFTKYQTRLAVPKWMLRFYCLLALWKIWFVANILTQIVPYKIISSKMFFSHLFEYTLDWNSLNFAIILDKTHRKVLTFNFGHYF